MLPRVLLVCSIVFFICFWIYFLSRPKKAEPTTAPATAVAAKPAKDSLKMNGSDSAKKLLQEAIALIEKNSVYKDSLRWDTVHKAALARLASSKTTADAYPVINEIFDKLKDNHSFIMPRDASKSWKGNDSADSTKKPKPVMGSCIGKMLADNIAYIRVSWVNTGNEKEVLLVADSIQKLIKHLDVTRPRRWIVDLRRNSGGNCWPMLAGLGALLGNGTYGFFISPADTVAWSYKDGKMMAGNEVVVTVSNPYAVQRDIPKIAVLVDSATASSGEVTAISFKGALNTRMFGRATAGYTSANQNFDLFDGSILLLATAFEADRTGQLYKKRVDPDEIITKKATEKNKDPVQKAAVEWLKSENEN